jgi:hypothetical protein
MICGDENFILTEDELVSCMDWAQSSFFFLIPQGPLHVKKSNLYERSMKLGPVTILLVVVAALLTVPGSGARSDNNSGTCSFDYGGNYFV